MVYSTSSCGHGTKAVIQNHKSINERRIRMPRPTDMDPRTKGAIRRFVVCRSVCHFVLVFFSPFSFAITSLGEGGGGAGSWSWCFSCVCSVCACLDLSVSSSFWGLGRAAVCDCGTSWTFLLPFL